MTDPDFVDDFKDGNFSLLLHTYLLETIEVSLNAVGKASKLRQAKIKVKRCHNFQKIITFVRDQL